MSVVDYSKYLLPWTRMEYTYSHRKNEQIEIEYVRHILVPRTGTKQCAIVFRNGKWEYDLFISDKYKYAEYQTVFCDTLEEAMLGKDNDLLARGFVFITEEQAEKIKLLI
jgi:hypothetical protein